MPMRPSPDALDAASPDAGSYGPGSRAGGAGLPAASPLPADPRRPPSPVSCMTIVDGLRRLLKPRHIAVAGGRLAAVIIRESERIGYAGPIWPIHPEKSEIAGHRAYRSAAD